MTQILLVALGCVLYLAFIILAVMYAPYTLAGIALILVALMLHSLLVDECPTA